MLMKRTFVPLFALLLCALTVLAQNTGGVWYVNLTQLTTTPTSISTFVGVPPPPNTTIRVCQGIGKTSAGTSNTITFKAANESAASWDAIAPFSASAASTVKFWEAGSNLACEVYPGGMLVSASGSGIYFKASGTY